MGFESGSVSFRLFYLPKELPKDCIDRFAANAAPSLAALDRQGISGWVTGYHLLDRDITNDRAYMAGKLYLQLMKAELKIPEALLKAECKMGELVKMRDDGVQFITRQMRNEIKKEVTDRLLKDMPPTLTGIPMVYDEKSRFLYVGAISDKQVDAFVLSFSAVTGIRPLLMTPDALAVKTNQFDMRHLLPTSFSPDCADEDSGDSLGQDFLTWLWFFVEQQGAIATFNDAGRVGVLLEGPLTFEREGAAAYVTVLRKGIVLNSAEAKIALQSGKKLKSAKLTLVSDAGSWTCMLGADEFLFRSLKLPKCAAKDPVGRFEERIMALDAFRQAFIGFFGKFVDLRRDPELWQKAQKEIQAWVANRDSVM